MPLFFVQLLSHGKADRFHEIGILQKFPGTQVLGHLYTLSFGETAEDYGLLFPLDL